MATQDQLNDIIKQNKYINVDKYHEKGIKGQNINILVIDGEKTHSEINKKRVLDIAPEANVILASMSSITKNGVINAILNYENTDYSLEELIEKYKIKIITRSLGGGTAENTPESKFWLDLRNKYNLIINQSSGNEKVGASIPHDVCIWCTQVNMGKNGIVKLPTIANGEQIDFAMFSGYDSGSSFASPALAGLEALIIQSLGEYGLNMTHTEMFNYLRIISKDLFEEGKDIKVGYGIPVLKMDKKYITMTTKSNQYYIDGKEYKMDCTPVNLGGTVYAPLRVISEALGYNIETSFNRDKTIHIVISNEKDKVIINTNNEKMSLNGNEIIIKDIQGKPLKPFIDENNRTLIPLRALTQSLGSLVDWVQEESKVMILEG